MRHGPIRDLLAAGYVAAQRLRRQGSSAAWRLAGPLRGPHEVVEEFDVWAYLSELAERISLILHDHDIKHLLLEDRLLSAPIVVVAHHDRRRALEALRADSRSRLWWVARLVHGIVGRPVPVRWQLPLLGGETGLMVSRDLRTTSRRPLTDGELGVALAFWKVLPDQSSSPGGGVRPAGTMVAPVPNGVLDQIGPDLWRRIQRDGHRLTGPGPHLLAVSEPVDLVYTWVDGTDPQWLDRKARGTGQPVSGYSTDADIAARFVGYDELRYSLRSVQMYANWVRHIWIVTDRQQPSWLQPDDRLTVVDHQNIFADPGALPVFNSHAIESQLHHIPNLAEHYLYLNDDMLFGRPVRPEDFFHGNGISKFFTSPSLIDYADHESSDLAVTAAAKNNRDWLEAEFGRTITNKLRHTPQPQLRSVLEAFEAAHPALFDDVMRSKYRHASDYSLTSSLSQYWSFARGNAVTGRIQNGYIDIASPEPEVTLERWLRRRDRQCLCINDSGQEDPDRQRAVGSALKGFFDAYYPLPSRWEKADEFPFTQGRKRQLGSGRHMESIVKLPSLTRVTKPHPDGKEQDCPRAAQRRIRRPGTKPE